MRLTSYTNPSEACGLAQDEFGTLLVGMAWND